MVLDDLSRVIGSASILERFSILDESDYLYRCCKYNVLVTSMATEVIFPLNGMYRRNVHLQ